MRAIERLLVLVVCAVLSACSASAVRRQIVISNALVIADDKALTQVGRMYGEQIDLARQLACGHAEPCPDPGEAIAAMDAVIRKWASVWAAWGMLDAAHDAWATQLERCQNTLSDAGDAGVDTCGPQLSDLAIVAAKHLDEVRCALRAMGVGDPFEGEVKCGGVK